MPSPPVQSNEMPSRKEMFGLWARNRYTLALDGAPPVELEPRETLLNGALRHGLDFPYSCKVGGCGSCKCRLLSGRVRELTDKAYLLTKEEIRQNYILGCQSVPLSNVVVSLPLDPFARQRAEGTIVQQNPLTHDIMEIVLKLDTALHYRAGQHASVQASGTDIPARCYSFAHACTAGGSRGISFFVRAVPGGRMSHWLMDPASLGRSVRLNAALGDFHLRESDRDLLCVAGGSGLAPLIALLEDAVTGTAARRNVYLLMGARRPRDLYCLETIRELGQRWQGRFEFVPVLSEEPADGNWQGQRGWVTEAITPAMVAAADAYLCGPPPMIDAAIARMTAFGMSPEHIHFDKFSDQTAGLPRH